MQMSEYRKNVVKLEAQLAARVLATIGELRRGPAPETHAQRIDRIGRHTLSEFQRRANNSGTGKK